MTSTLAYRPGWTFKVAGPEGRYLCVFVNSTDSLCPQRTRVTQHQFEYPDEALTGPKEWARWVFAQLLKAEWHEAAEWFQLGGLRPFWPNHQDEGSPYEPVERWES